MYICMFVHLFVYLHVSCTLQPRECKNCGPTSFVLSAAHISPRVSSVGAAPLSHYSTEPLHQNETYIPPTYITWKWRRAPLKTTNLYLRPSMGFRVSLGARTSQSCPRHARFGSPLRLRISIPKPNSSQFPHLKPP